MELRSITCPACGGREFTLEEAVEDGELTGVDLRCARGCGFYTCEAGDRSEWRGADGRVAAVQPPARRDGHAHQVAGVADRHYVRPGEPREEEQRRAMMPIPNEHPAAAECPQCGREVETTLNVYRDGSGAYVYGMHCPECGEAVAMAMRFVLPGAVRWSALRAWLTGERIALESQIKRMPPDAVGSLRLRGRLDEAAMALQRMDDLERSQ